MSSTDGGRTVGAPPTPGPDPRVLAFGARHFGSAIRPATTADLGAMARIHAHSGTPGLLTDLGEPFLRDVFYAGLLASPLGHALVIEVGGNVAGFVTFSPDSETLFSDIFRHRLGATLRASTRASVRRPRIAIDFVETVFNVRGGGEGADIRAESVSLQVAPAFQGLGLGFLLLQSGVDALRASGVMRIKARVLAENRAVERLYPPLGFMRGSQFRLHGRDWVLWTLDVPDR